MGDYKDAPKSVQNIKIDHPDYPADKLPPIKFKTNMQMHGFDLQEMNSLFRSQSVISLNMAIIKHNTRVYGIILTRIIFGDREEQ